MATAIEELGLTEEKFNKMYDQYGGFNTTFNKNNPVRQEGETAYSFLRKGAKSLAKDNASLIKTLTEEG